MADTSLNDIDRYEDRSCKEAEAILRHVMHRQRWSITVRDELALRLRIFGNQRHLELSNERRKK
jgi:hypothetical protein